jgi:hypothetical protein
MESIYATDSFNAFKTGSGMTIEVKAKSTKKMGFIITFLGIAFFAVSFLDLGALFFDDDSSFSKFTTNTVYYVTRYGGITIIAGGILILVMSYKGPKSAMANVVLDTTKRELHLRKKTIPFSDITEIKQMNQLIMGRDLINIIVEYTGKKMPLVPPFMTKDREGVNRFVEEVKKVIQN